MDDAMGLVLFPALWDSSQMGHKYTGASVWGPRTHTHTHTDRPGNRKGVGFFLPWQSWHLLVGACIIMATGTVGFAYSWILMNVLEWKLNVKTFFSSWGHMVDSAQGGTWVHFEFVYACYYRKDEGEGWVKEDVSAECSCLSWSQPAMVTQTKGVWRGYNKAR